MEDMGVDAAATAEKENEGIPLVGIPKQKGPDWEACAWVKPEPNTAVLEAIEDIAIVPPPSIEAGVWMPAALTAEVAFLFVAIERYE